MNKVLIAIVTLGTSLSMLAQDSKPKPVAPSSSVNAQLHQLEDEDQKLEQHEQQLAKAMSDLQADLKLQHQRNRERQALIKSEDQEWNKDLMDNH